MTDPRVAAALAAEAVYLRECDDRRARRSCELHGHSGANVPSCAPDPVERMTRALTAAAAVAVTPAPVVAA